MRHRLGSVCVALAAMLALSLLAAACDRGSATSGAFDTPVASPPLPTPTPEPETLVWKNCDDGFECSLISVPLDDMEPDGRRIQLALIRLPSSRPAERMGSLLVNPGGPGASGVDFVRFAGKDVFPAEVRARFDIVGFDPRGVGGSVPAVDCVDDPGEFITAGRSRSRDIQRKAAIDFAAACASRSGALLPYLSAPHVAHDMDLIRASLGDDKLTYVGFSYGTLLGATYAGLFPKNVRAMVLDGALDPSLNPNEFGSAQDSAFDDALNAFLDDCAANTKCAFYSDADPGGAFDHLVERITDHPLHAKESGDTRVVDEGVAWTAIDEALYDRETGWPLLARALALADTAGDGSLLLQLADRYDDRRDGAYSNKAEAHIAIDCADSPHPILTPAASGTAVALAPANSGLGLSPCDYWPVQSDRKLARITARGAPRILVIGTRGDPATPYEEARALADQLSSGVLLTYNGEGHTAYGGRSSCIDRIVDDYLISGTSPSPGTACD